MSELSISLAELTVLLQGELSGPPERTVSGLKGIEEAGPADVAFLANPKYAKALPGCRAGVVLVGRDQNTPEGLAVIRVDDPYLAYAKLLTHATQKPYEPLGVHPRAVVEDSATLGGDVSIHPLAYVGRGAVLGDRVVLHPGAYVGPGAKVGDDSELRANVVLEHGCIIGKRCRIHAGTVIGSDGYGFAKEGERHFKIPQIGIVQIDDDVELGANNTVDRAATSRTWIQSGVKTDNLVHIAHNCTIGENTLLVAQVGISGSCKVGNNVIMGGQAGVAGHITIPAGTILATRSGLTKSPKKAEVLAGFPTMPHRNWLRIKGFIKKLPELFERVRKLESRLDGE